MSVLVFCSVNCYGIIFRSYFGLLLGDISTRCNALVSRNVYDKNKADHSAFDSIDLHNLIRSWWDRSSSTRSYQIMRLNLCFLYADGF